MGRQLNKHIGALAVLFVVAAAIYWPIRPLPSWPTSVPAGDGAQAVYYLNWAQHLSPLGLARYHDIPLFYPLDGMGAISEYNLLLGVLTAPLRVFGNPVFSYNLAMMVGLLILAACAYVFCTEFSGGCRRAALVGAVVYTCNSKLMWHSPAHPSIFLSAFFPLSWLLLFRFLRGGPPWQLLAATMLAWMQCCCSFYTGVMTLMGLGFIWAAGCRLRRRETLLPIVAAAVLLAVLYIQSGPYRDIQRRLGATRGLSEAAYFASDWTAYLLPSRSEVGPRTILGAALTDRIAWTQRYESTCFFGYSGLALIVIGCVVAWRRRRSADAKNATAFFGLLGILAAIGVVLSLGPFFWMGNRITTIRLPFYYLYMALPPIRFMRATSRFAVMALPFAGAAVTLALAHWRIFRTSQWPIRIFVTAALLAVMVVEYLAVDPPPTTRIVPDARHALERHPELRVVAPIPWEATQFVVDSASTFVASPSGHDGGSYSHRREWLTDRMRAFPSTESLAILGAFNVEAIVVYTEAIAQFADGSNLFAKIERWDGGGLYRIQNLDPAETAKMIAQLGAVDELPPVYTGNEWPADLPAETRWEPVSWSWLSDDGSAWIPLAWSEMSDGRYIYHNRHQFFHSGIASRPLGSVPRVAARFSVNDPGVDFVRARVYWLTLDHGWAPERSVAAFVRPDGDRHVVVFDLSAAPAWDPGETLTALQFEFTETPFPGERLRVKEIRVGGTSSRKE